MKNFTQITPENVTDFPAGTRLEFNYGAYYPVAKGVVTGFEIVAATKFFPAIALLKVLVDTFDDDGNQTQRENVVTQIFETDRVGPIGTYLIERAPELTKANTKSPWAVQE